MVVYGVRLYGKVDETSAGHVATRFVHIWFIPFVPMSSWFVMGEGSGAKVPISIKSIFAAYARGWGVAATLICTGLFLYFLIFNFFADMQIYVNGGTAVTEEDLFGDVILLGMLGGTALLGLLAFIAARFLKKASQSRCQQLATLTGVQMSTL